MPHRPCLLLSCLLLLSACAEKGPAERAPEASLDTTAAPASAVTSAAAPAPVPLEGDEARLFGRAGVSLLKTESGFALRSNQSGRVTEMPGRPVFSPDAERLAVVAGRGVEIWTVRDGVAVREWSSGPLAPLAGAPRWEDATTIVLPTAAGGTLLVTNPGPGWMVMEPAG